MKKISKCILVMAALLLIICSVWQDNVKAANNVKIKITNLSGTKITLNKGKNKVLKLNIKNYKVKSSNKKVVRTARKGKKITLKAVNKGNAKITITSGKKKKVLKVTVLIKATGVNVSSKNIKMYTGDTTTIKATVLPSNANNKGVSWSSSNNNIITIDKNGKITAKKAGNAVITVKTTDGSNKKSNCYVEVEDPVNIATVEKYNEKILKVVLTKKQKLSKDNFKVKIQKYEYICQATLPIVGIYTSDEKTYYLYILLSGRDMSDGYYGSAFQVEDFGEDIMVKVEVSGLMGHKGAAEKECYCGEIKNKITYTYEMWEGKEFEKCIYPVYAQGRFKVEYQGKLPEGITKEEYIEREAPFIIFQGTPTKAGKYSYKLIETTELGNVIEITLNMVVYPYDKIILRDYPADTNLFLDHETASKAFELCGRSENLKVTLVGEYPNVSQYFNTIIDKKRVVTILYNYIEGGKPQKVTMRVEDEQYPDIVYYFDVMITVDVYYDYLVRVVDEKGNLLTNARICLENKTTGQEMWTHIGDFTGEKSYILQRDWKCDLVVYYGNGICVCEDIDFINNGVTTIVVPTD